MKWSTRMGTIRKSITIVKVASGFILVEQLFEVLSRNISLAEHPVIVIAALGALGFPVPSKKEPEDEVDP